MFSKNILDNENLYNKMLGYLLKQSHQVMAAQRKTILGAEPLINFLLNEVKSTFSANNVTLLINGEQKFPEVIKALQSAKQFIHLEYYIFEDDEIGRTIINLLKLKAAEGVQVRFIYDDFGSRSINRHVLNELRKAGVHAFPFYKVRILFLANRLNYRDHRKIIIVDGRVGFIGGINVSDRYINKPNGKGLFWRDTHLKILGPAVHSLHYHFISNWNFCSGKKLELRPEFFRSHHLPDNSATDLVQVVAGGPDYPGSSVMLNFFSAIVNARKRVYITSPYFIPSDSICDALKTSALSGCDVRLLLPGISDSMIVNAAARSYYGEMLAAGVRIFLYQKGFVHAKTMVVDDLISVVGTANMDTRSFDLNFEINAVVYSSRICSELAEAFFQDIANSKEILFEDWNNRTQWQELRDGVARLLSPLL
jgi:cardiolipin synthase